MSYIPTSPFISKSIIISSSSLVLVKQLCAPYKSALYIVFVALNLIFNCPGFEFTVTIYRGLLTRRPLFYILCIP